MYKSWLSGIPNDTLISNINLPGSHDAAAIGKKKGFWTNQDKSILDQLDCGIRILDVRLKVKREDDQFCFITCHGDNWFVDTTRNEFQSFNSLMEECKNFLENNETEFIIIILKIDDWNGFFNDRIQIIRSLKLYLQGFSVYNYNIVSDIPKIVDVRKKIIMYNRIEELQSLGAPIRWDDNTPGMMTKLGGGLDRDIYIQDKYKHFSNRNSEQEKLELVTKAFNEKKDSNIVLNFASAIWYGIIGIYINHLLLDYLEKLSLYDPNKPQQPRRKIGWLMIDYGKNRDFKTETNYKSLISNFVLLNFI